MQISGFQHAQWFVNVLLHPILIPPSSVAARRDCRPLPPHFQMLRTVIFSVHIGRIYICDMIPKVKYHSSPLLYIYMGVRTHNDVLWAYLQLLNVQ